MLNDAKISIDIKRNSIRIHRKTLSNLGMPHFIQLLINPKDMLLGIQAVEKNCPDSHRVTPSFIPNDYSFELYSKTLIQELQQLVPVLSTDATYNLIGKIFENNKLALFSLNDLKINESRSCHVGS